MTWAQFLWLFFGFSGRIDRKAYALAGVLTYLVRMFAFYRVIVAEQAGADSTGWAAIFLAGTLVTLFCGVALSAKRLHDFDKPTGLAWLFVFLDVLMFLALCFVPGNPGPNRYGAVTNDPARPS